MKVQAGDILQRSAYKDHWLICKITDYGNDVYQWQVLNLELGTQHTYTSPFGLDIPEGVFYKVA